MRAGLKQMIAASAIVATAVSCGGGGYSGGSSSTSAGGGYGSMPMPTVKFTAPSPATTINLGQAVQLSWTTSYATSCSATASSTIGGAFREVSPVLPGGFVGEPVQLDTGAPGALFGIVASVDAQGDQLVYFNDDNSNAVMMLTK
jgi:hypothetical protein